MAGKTRQKPIKFPVPEDFLPFSVFYDEGSPGLTQRMSELDIDHIKGVLSRYTHTPRKDYAKLENKDQLVAMAVKGIKDIACHGEAFGDYKLPY